MATTEVLKKLFSKELQKNIFPDNAFYKLSKVDVAGENAITVEVPNAGTVPSVIVDASQFPLQTEHREDTKVSYTTQTFSTQPTLLTDVNALLVTYNKRADILSDHSMVLNTRIAEVMANVWAPTALTVGNARQTTGTTSRAANASLGLTGTRKKVALADLAEMQLIFDRDDIPSTNRYAAFPATMYNDLIQLSEFISYTDRDADFGKLLAMGVVGEIYGFKVMKRSSMLVYSEDAALGNIVKRAVGASYTATDNEAALFWHSSFVRRAEGSPKVYINADKAEYQGTIMSAMVRAGGTPSYVNGRGVAVLLQDN
jgi:hypothetical protein